MTEAPTKPETLEKSESLEVIRVAFKEQLDESETECHSTQRQALRSGVIFWSLLMLILYCSFVQFSSAFMSNGKSQFQRVAQSIGGSSGN